jgi:hypothetical protein
MGKKRGAFGFIHRVKFGWLWSVYHFACRSLFFFWCLMVMDKDMNEKRADSSLFLFRIRLTSIILPSVLCYLLFPFPNCDSH